MSDNLEYVEDIKAFFDKHEGKEMKFHQYYKFQFTYDFTDEEGVDYRIVCGDTTGDIYRDTWSNVEIILPYMTFGFVNSIYIKRGDCDE
jgi:predicted phosphodiesterase